LTDDLAGLAASGVDRQPEYLWLLRARYPVYQIASTNEHVAPSNSMPPIVSQELGIEERVIAALAVIPASHMGSSTDLERRKHGPV
jgi:hypothetical protein